MGKIKKMFVIECDESAENWLFDENLEELLNSIAQGGPYRVSEVKQVQTLPIPTVMDFDDPNKVREGMMNISLGFTNMGRFLKDYAAKYNLNRKLDELCGACSDKQYCFKPCKKVEKMKRK